MHCFRLLGLGGGAAVLVVAACGTYSPPGPNDSEAGKATGGSASAGAGATSAVGGSQGTVGGSGSAGQVGVAGSVMGDGGGEVALGGAGGESSGPRRPNIVIALLDDMGYSDLGTYGSEIKTPNIDALADGGMRFRNFYVTPRCSPTRMSLLTGQYTQQVATQPGDPLPPLRPDNNVTLPELLAASGYRTYMAGKWHLGETEPQFPRSRGFQHVFGMGPDGAGTPPPINKWDPAKYNLLSEGDAIAKRTYAAGEFYQSQAIGEYAVDYLDHHFEQQDDAPFFMYLAFNAPHFPIQAPKGLADAYVAQYSAGWDEVRNQRFMGMKTKGVLDATFGLSPREPFMDPEQAIPLWSTLSVAQQADLTRKMALYAASIESVDISMGRVVDRLKQLGQFDNTIILVLSDNGGNYEGGVLGRSFESAEPVTGAQLAKMGQAEQADDHVMVGGGWASVQSTPFRFYKHYTHGGGVRSPLVVSWPNHVGNAGGWTNQVAHVIDLAPTILAAAEVAHPDTFAGRAVLPLEGRPLLETIAQTGAPFPRQLGFEHETNRAYIDGKFKLVVRHENADQIELYNLETDPVELDDLASEQPKRVASMVESWNNWATRVGVPAGRLLPVP